MELVTGRAGSPHITAQQDRQLHQGIWGEEAYILAMGNQLKPEVQSSNKILIKDGALMFQGALFSVKVGTTDEITINNGNQGMLRKDLVVARYTYDSSENIESAEWVVIQGEPAASNPEVPTGTTGDIQAGDATVDCPFLIVNLDGINVTRVDIIPEKVPTIPELIGKSVRFSGWTSISSPFTAPADGFLRVNFSPDSSSRVGTGVITENVAGTVSSSGISNGSNVMATIPVIQGNTYTIAGYPSGNIDIAAAFMPLRL